MFENVNSTHYTETLGRSAVPNAAEFDRLAFEEKLEVKIMYDDGLIREREKNGIDNAVCMRIEEAYKAEQDANGANNVDTSESIGGYSHSMSAKKSDLANEKNFKSVAQRKYKWLSLYCEMLTGVK